MNKTYIYGIIVLCIWLMYQFPHIMLNPGELVEGHQKLNDKCLSCHEPFSGIPNDKCIDCHKLAEIGKDTAIVADTSRMRSKILFHHELSGQACTSCHTDHQGAVPVIPISTFDHEILSAALISNCVSCHHRPSDILHKQLPDNCKSCHTTSTWKLEGRFDHNMIAVSDRNKCESCHNAPVDSYHHLFKETCSKCHTADKWVPSSFDHDSYFQLDKDHNVKCNTCHTNNNFSAYTCYGCHEHSKSKIMQEHNEEGIFNFENCISCHKSANEHDIIRNGDSGKVLNEKEVNGYKKYINTVTDKKSEKHNGKEEKEND